MKLFHGTIRKKLVLLVLLSTAPVFLVLLGTELVNRQSAVREAEKDTALFLNGFAEIQRRITESTQTLLRTVASIPDIRNADVEGSRVILSALLETNPIYTNVILVDIKGNVVAAGRNHDKARKFNFKDRKQFREAIAAKGFASGEFVVGKSSQKAIFPFGMAVQDSSGVSRGVLLIGVDLSHYGRLFERGSYPEGAFFGLCDHRGIRLFRYPVSERIAIGKPIKPKVFQAVSASGGAGSVLAKAPDGLKRLIAFEPLRIGENGAPYMHMFMGFDHDQTQARVNAILIRGGITIFVSLTLALAIAWFIGGSGIARRVEKLTWMTKLFASGEENVNSGIDYSDGEVGELAESFDQLVLMLRQREDERNAAQNLLTSSELRFSEIIEDVSAISVQGYDENRQVIFWNHASEDLYGYTNQEASGKKLEDLIIPNQMKEEVIRLHTQWVEKGIKIPSGELILIDKSGNDVPVFSSHVMHETQSGKEMFCIDTDLRPIKESEAEKKHLIERLQQAQKMEAIGTLAGGIAHDFNNILFPIIGYTEILLEDTVKEDISSRKNLNQIYTSALRAKELVQQILTFSRQEISEYKPIKLQPILEEVVKLLGSTIPKNIEIKQTVDAHCRAVNADATHIHQIMMNLATNAYHAMADSGGTLKIHLSEVDIGQADIKDLGISPGKFACLSVADTGIGMAPDVVGKIFDPFFTTKEKGKGTGMGLSVVHGIVKNMKGCIHVNTNPGLGTQFKVYLPIDRTPVTGPQVKSGVQAAFPSGTERILLVDDDNAILEMEMLSLKRLGYIVTVENNPLDALETFGQCPDAFDLVLTDMSMPKMSGDKLAQELLRLRRDIPIILCTGFSENITPDIAESIGIKAVLMKPVMMKELFKNIRRALDDNAVPEVSNG